MTRRSAILVVLVCHCPFLLPITVAAQSFKLGGSPARDMPPIPAQAVDENGAANPAPQQVLLPEFPPGLFSDGRQYRLNDLFGKTIVLFFFDGNDDRALATLSQRNAIVRRFSDKPVAFFGVQVDSIRTVQNTADATDLEMPIFADTLGVLAARYHVTLTRAASWHAVIIDGDGQISDDRELTVAAIEKTLARSKWKYRTGVYDPRVLPAVNAFESGQYETGARLLNSALDAADRKSADSARSFQTALYARSDQWKAHADALIATDPIAARDLYTRITVTFPCSGMARAVADPLKRLSANQRVRDELAARGMYDVLCGAIAHDEQITRPVAAAYCQQIIRAHPDTPTAERLVKYLDDLGKARDHAAPASRRSKRG
jgi:peroxiredoxin